MRGCERMQSATNEERKKEDGQQGCKHPSAHRLQRYSCVLSSFVSFGFGSCRDVTLRDGPGLGSESFSSLNGAAVHVAVLQLKSEGCAWVIAAWLWLGEKGNTVFLPRIRVLMALCVLALSSPPAISRCWPSSTSSAHPSTGGSPSLPGHPFTASPSVCSAATGQAPCKTIFFHLLEIAHRL